MPRRNTIFGIICLALVALLFAHFYQVAEGWYWWTVDDWKECFRPAALSPHPYAVGQHVVTYPTWFFWLIAPLAVLPVHLGHGVLTMLSLLVLCLYVKDWWRLLLLVLSTPVLSGLIYGHPDALLVAAFMVPIDMALIVVSCKPMALFGWAVRKWLSDKHPFWRMLPFVVVLLVSFVVHPGWPVELASTLGGLNNRDSMPLAWPAMIPIGLLLLFTKDERLWLVGSLFLTPYLQRYHLTPLLAFFYKRERWPVLVVMTLITWAWTWYGGF